MRFIAQRMFWPENVNKINSKSGVCSPSCRDSLRLGFFNNLSVEARRCAFGSSGVCNGRTRTHRRAALRRRVGLVPARLLPSVRLGGVTHKNQGARLSAMARSTSDASAVKCSANLANNSRFFGSVARSRMRAHSAASILSFSSWACMSGSVHRVDHCAGRRCVRTDARRAASTRGQGGWERAEAARSPPIGSETAWSPPSCGPRDG